MNNQNPFNAKKAKFLGLPLYQPTDVEKRRMFPIPIWQVPDSQNERERETKSYSSQTSSEDLDLEEGSDQDVTFTSYDESENDQIKLQNSEIILSDEQDKPIKDDEEDSSDFSSAKESIHCYNDDEEEESSSGIEFLSQDPVEKEAKKEREIEEEHIRKLEEMFNTDSPTTTTTTPKGDIVSEGKEEETPKVQVIYTPPPTSPIPLPLPPSLLKRKQDKVLMPQKIYTPGLMAKRRKLNPK